ncbi:MAG: phosphoglycerate mutase, partial [bacterium]|nr:phosphoglycerate mutase [bacterium]
MTRRKLVLVILDGLGDLPQAALGGQTPLQAAKTPHLDAMAARGTCGLLDPMGPGVVVETHAGTAPLMGLESGQADDFARGPVEAAGAGLVLAPGDVALRGNFATLAPSAQGFNILDRRAGRIDENAAELLEAVNAIEAIDGVNFLVHPLQQHRVVVKLSGDGLSAQITDTDPGTAPALQTLRSSEPRSADDPAAARTAGALNALLRRAHEVLDAHPLNAVRSSRGLHVANGLLTRGAGNLRRQEGLMRLLGLRGALVAGDRAVLGLGRMLGIAPITQAGFTGLVDSDPLPKIEAAREALADHDVVWVHYKGTDIASHDQQPLAKRDCIERFDTALGALADEDLVIGVTADHTTDSNTGS